MTNTTLKMCNIVRDKNYGSKSLFKKTGVICGAKAGVSNVYEPVLVTNMSKLNMSNDSISQSKPGTQGSFFAHGDEFRETTYSNENIRPNT